MIKKYRKKPVVIEAIKLTKENLSEVFTFLGIENLDVSKTIDDKGIGIKPLEGNHYYLADWGDYIIKDIKEFYSVKPDIFKKTYEEVNE